MSEHSLLELTAFLVGLLLLLVGVNIAIRLVQAASLKRTVHELRGELNLCRDQVARLKRAVNRLNWCVARAFTIVDDAVAELETYQLRLSVATVKLKALRGLVTRLRSFLHVTSNDAESLADGAEVFLQELEKYAPLNSMSVVTPVQAGSAGAAAKLGRPVHPI
jgi:hypothetical protein